MLTCPPAEKRSKNIRVRTLEGAIYTVDDVSDLLGIPRPTLYRYLREYSIPHLRQGGRIRIPEDSFDRIREARDLHKEGLVTETVRRQLREGGGPDTGELDRRLNKLHDTLEDLRGDLRARPATGEVAPSPALQTILARQSLMLSAMFNLTGMVEHLLLNNSKTRKRPVARVEGGLAPPVPLRAEERGQLPATLVAAPVAVREVEAPEISPPAQNIPTSFGSLGRRRRRGALAVLSALLLGLLLFFFLPSPDGEETTSDGSAANGPAEQQKSPEERPAGTDAQRADAEGGGEQADAPVAAPERTPVEQEGDEAATAARESGGGVPDVSGSSLEEAAKTLSEAGHGVAAIRGVRSQEEPGTVTGTEPPAGVEAGDADVVLTVSAGPTGVSSANAAPASSSATSSSSSGATSVAASSASAPSASASASPSP
jgi:excisionase family DNA binding protein